MTIREIQEETANALNGVEELVNGGCKAIAEDAQDVLFETRQALEAGNVCIVVATPKAVRSGGGTADGIPAKMLVSVQCSEIPDLNRAVAGHLTALDAAHAQSLAAQIARGEEAVERMGAEHAVFGLESLLESLHGGGVIRLARRKHERAEAGGRLVALDLNDELAPVPPGRVGEILEHID